MYAPEQGLFKAQLFIKRRGTTYHAFLTAGGTHEVSAKLDELPSLPPLRTVSPGEYGRQLFDWVFRSELHEQWMLLRDLSRGSSDQLPSIRLQLSLDPDSPLSALYWEAMTPSASELPLSATVAFSRYVSQVRPSPQMEWERPVRLLLIVSNPEGLQRFDLDEVDQSVERRVLQGAEARLQGVLTVKRLPRATLQAIREEERRGYHVTHLLAHASTDPNMNGVILADEQGKAVAVDIRELADAIAGPPDARSPHLVFLALPVTVDPPHGQVRMQLASQLITGGVQSVAVVQAPLQPDALATFVSRFYEVLIETGEVDISMAEARKWLFRERSEEWDWVWPVLFSRGGELSLPQGLPREFASNIGKIRFEKS
jgi:CHAT domain